MSTHTCCGGLCVMPPAPELEEKILKSKQQFLSGVDLDDVDDVDILDMRTFTLISSRPRQTRAHNFQASPGRGPVTGTRKAIVLLVDFSDKAASETQAHFQDMLFSLGSYATGSMRDFYKEASYNQLDVTGSIAGQGGPTSGFFRAPKPKSYYTDGNYGFNAYPKNAQKLVEDVIGLANPFVNFSDYDNDGDGFVEALVVICAGIGGEQSGSVNDIWSHKWGISPKSVDGVKIDRYFMAPENGRVGVMAHELGHLLLELPDLYDTDYSSRGTGRWDLMAGGSWNNGGDTPAHPTAWCKYKAGWIDPTVIFDEEKSVTLNSYQADSGSVYKLPVGDINSKEYFLISNRHKDGFDAHLPGEGLIIEHIDENKANNTDENHYLVDIEQADGQRHLNINANSGDAEDAFPTASNNEFMASSAPNSNSYAGSDSKIAVTDIARSGDTITAKVNVGGVSVISWHNNKSVLKTFASPHSMNAWAYIKDLGWRQIERLSPDGVANMHVQLCKAQVNSKLVNVYADNNFIYQAYSL